MIYIAFLTGIGASVSIVTGLAGARECVDTVDTGAPIATRTGLTLVNIHFTLTAFNINNNQHSIQSVTYSSKYDWAQRSKNIIKLLITTLVSVIYRNAVLQE